jgi:hypothetical protein
MFDSYGRTNNSQARERWRSTRLAPVEHVLQQPVLDRRPVDRARARVHGLVRRDRDVREEVREVAHAVERAHARQERPPRGRALRRYGRRRRRQMRGVLLVCRLLGALACEIWSCEGGSRTRASETGSSDAASASWSNSASGIQSFGR